MGKKLGFSFFCLILFCLFLPSFALTDYTVGEGTVPAPEQDLILQKQEELKTMQLINTQYSALSQKIDELDAKNAAYLTEMAKFIDQRVGGLYSTFIIGFIIVIAAGIGLWYAIFFYFKAKRVI